jgi:hypothetical protein
MILVGKKTKIEILSVMRQKKISYFSLQGTESHLYYKAKRGGGSISFNFRLKIKFYSSTSITSSTAFLHNQLPTARGMNFSLP